MNILLSTILPVSFPLGEGRNNIQLVSDKSTQYLGHKPIKINNNIEFTNTAFIENWPGNGTSSSPYIISGYAISYYTTNLIYIRNCDVYFIITNNTLNGIDGRYRGIELFNISNGYVANNSIFNCHTGIQCWATGNFSIYNNLVAKNDWSGIYLRDSGNMSLLNNYISSNGGDGIEIRGSKFCTQAYNIISYNNEYGILLDSSSEYNKVIFNDFTKNCRKNRSQAFDDGLNNEFTFNYWDNWITPDVNADGIVDFPYLIEGDAENQDLHPLVSKFFDVSRSCDMNPIVSNVFAGLMLLLVTLCILVSLILKRRYF